jgi:CubicO group peptidase (beta-lactamase class C family)
VTVAVDRLPEYVSDEIASLLTSSVPRVAPAMAVSVWHDGEPLYEAAFGRMDAGDRLHATRLDARFDLASVTKLFTTTAVLRLAAEGRLALDDPVVSTIPDLGVVTPRTVDGGQEPLSRRLLPTPPDRVGWLVDPAEVTVRQLLAHTSGLAPWRAVFEAAGPIPPPPDEPDPIERATRWRRGLEAVYRYPFVDRPGRSIGYSDLGFMLLGLMIQHATRADLETAMRDLVTAPLGLGSVTYTPLRSGVPRTSVVPTSVDELWRRRRSWGEVEDENCAGLGGVSGHAGLFGDVRDVARFGEAWLDRDPRARIGTELMREAVREQAASGDDRRGLGWQLRTDDGMLGPLSASSFGHTGFTGTSIAIDPARGLVVALLTNRVYAGRTHQGIDGLRIDFHALLARRI